MADFSPQIGSEIKGKHFAIVLTKNDRNSNELLTVIPLTSKFHKYHIDFGNEIYVSIYQKIMNSLESIIKASRDLNDTFNNEEYTEINKQIEMCNQISERYKLLKEHTYGKPQQITTISKYRIIKPSPIRKLKVSNEVMDLIDKAIIKLFTR